MEEVHACTSNAAGSARANNAVFRSDQLSRWMLPPTQILIQTSACSCPDASLSRLTIIVAVEFKCSPREYPGYPFVRSSSSSCRSKLAFEIFALANYFVLSLIADTIDRPYCISKNNAFYRHSSVTFLLLFAILLIRTITVIFAFFRLTTTDKSAILSRQK